ncbi:MAG: TrkA family potassium uptake protein [Oscillospiraceae bacterium]|nr:TrkA family potassium uptake protein [Oscillospiraceae bacterium]
MKRKKTEKIFGVIGLGRFGMAVAKELAAAGSEVLVIDRLEQRVRSAREFTENAYVTDDLSKENLEQMGVGACDTVIIGITSKLDMSLLTALNAVNLGVPRVIAKSTSPEHGELLEKIGAEVVYPERDMGLQLAKRLCAKSVMEYISLSNDVDITELRVPERYVGQEVRSCGIRRDYGVNIIALRSGETTVTSIQPDYRFSPEDVLVLIGGSADMQRFTKAMQK